MKTISILLALVNSLAAALVITASITRVETIRQLASLWLVVKIAASLGVIACGVLIWVAAGRATDDKLVLLSGLFVLTVGTASAVWTVHLAVVNGALQDQMFLFGSSLMAQGSASIWTLLQEARAVAGI